MPRFRPANLAALLAAPMAQAVGSDFAGQLSKYHRSGFFGSNTTQRVGGGNGSACRSNATELQPRLAGYDTTPLDSGSPSRLSSGACLIHADLHRIG